METFIVLHLVTTDNIGIYLHVYFTTKEQVKCESVKCCSAMRN